MLERKEIRRIPMIQPRRKIAGMSAILLPFAKAHPGSAPRPPSDVEILCPIEQRVRELLS
jgi:hypothetical protein